MTQPEEQSADPTEGDSRATESKKPRRPGNTALFLIGVFLIVLRFVHLDADFPYRYARSGDLYTDEGWYNNNAMGYVLTGNWYIEGDFNTADNLPILPIFQAICFTILGVSLVSARLTVLFFFILLLVCLYIWIKTHSDARTAVIAVLLICINFNVFIYSRMALLELPMLFFVALSLWLASRPAEQNQLLWIGGAALSYVLAFLTKTTAIFALPVIIYTILQKQNPLADRFRQCACWSLIVGAGLLAYYFLLVRSHLPDYQAFFSTNMYTRTQMSLTSLVRSMAKTTYFGYYVDPILYIATLLYAVFIFWADKRKRSTFLFWACIIWIVSYLTALGTQNYTPPRFYPPLVVPVAILASLIFQYFTGSRFRTLPALIFGAALLGYATVDGYRIAQVALSPRYTWRDMARDVKNQIQADHTSHPVILGHFANSLTLSTGIFSINEQWGTKSLDYKIAKYQPNYYVCLGNVKPKTEAVLRRYYRIEKVREYNVFDNYYTGEPVTFYRLLAQKIAAPVEPVR